MPLTLFSNYIRAHADRGFLAACRCKDGVCSCNDFNPPYSPVHTSSHKGSSQMNIQDISKTISSMEASERKKLADAFIALPADKQAEVIEQLSVIKDVNAKQEAVANRKKVFISKLSAMRAEKNVGASNAIGLIEGTLRRAHLPPLEDLGSKTLHEINSLMASAKITTNERMAVKNILARLGAIE
jgi:hypothetical protein